MHNQKYEGNSNMGSRAKQLKIGLGAVITVAVAGGLAGVILLAVKLHT